MIVLLAVVGLAIDAGFAYLVKARLNAAVDSAALAGARAVTTGNNQAEQIASARTAAQDFFNANIANGYMGSSPRILNTNVAFQGGRAIIDVTAEAPLPVSIMQVVGFQSLAPVAAAQTIRNDLDMAFVIDTSGSLKTQGASVKSSAKTFLNKFNVTQDRVAMIRFASGSVTDYAIATSGRGFNRTGMLSKIDSIVFDGGTASAEGMYRAREQLNNVPLANRSAARVIVFFSDGDPTSFGTTVEFVNAARCLGVTGVIDRAWSEQAGLSNPNDTSISLIRSDCQAIPNDGASVSAVRRLPAVYNPRNSANKDDQFPIITTGPREVKADVYAKADYTRNIGRAARNLAEGVAEQAREDGMFVFTLGLGSQLKTPTQPDNEVGENILKCMANTPDALERCRKPNQPVGMYCYAATEADLTPCFSRLASAILRLTK